MHLKSYSESVRCIPIDNFQETVEPGVGNKRPDHPPTPSKYPPDNKLFKVDDEQNLRVGQPSPPMPGAGGQVLVTADDFAKAMAKIASLEKELQEQKTATAATRIVQAYMTPPCSKWSKSPSSLETTSAEGNGSSKEDPGDGEAEEDEQDEDADDMVELPGRRKATWPT